MYSFIVVLVLKKLGFWLHVSIVFFGNCNIFLFNGKLVLLLIEIFVIDDRFEGKVTGFPLHLFLFTLLVLSSHFLKQMIVSWKMWSVLRIEVLVGKISCFVFEAYEGQVVSLWTPLDLKLTLLS